MFTVTEDIAKVWKESAKRDQFAGMCMRRHDAGLGNERSSLFFSWKERNAAGDRTSNDHCIPIGVAAMSILDHTNGRSWKHGFIKVDTPIFQYIGRLIRPGDNIRAVLYLSPKYDYAELTIERGDNRRIVYTGIVDVTSLATSDIGRF